MKKKVSFTITLLFTLTLYSCAMLSNGAIDHPIDSLETSVNTLWKARMEKDWATVYDLTDRAYKKEMPKEKFTALGDLHVLEYKINQITPDPAVPDQYEVLINFSINKMGYVFKPVVKELWLLEKKQWVLNKSLMLNTKPL